LTLTETNREHLPADVIQAAGAATPVGRLLEPEEVARAMVFLGSGANAAITGELVRTSGGAVG
jgi:3-oxoacyl-[acyl-carrier protein] reductase